MFLPFPIPVPTMIYHWCESAIAAAGYRNRPGFAISKGLGKRVAIPLGSVGLFLMDWRIFVNVSPAKSP